MSIIGLHTPNWRGPEQDLSEVLSALAHRARKHAMLGPTVNTATFDLTEKVFT